MKNSSQHKGFVALILIILIGAILEIMVLELSGDISTYQSILSARESKENAYVNSLSCMNIATIEIAQNDSYTGNQSFSLASSSCRIDTISNNSQNEVVSVSSLFQHSKESLAGTLDEDLNILSIIEN